MNDSSDIIGVNMSHFMRGMGNSSVTSNLRILDEGLYENTATDLNIEGTGVSVEVIDHIATLTVEGGNFSATFTSYFPGGW